MFLPCSLWLKAGAGDRQDASAGADRALPPPGVPQAPDPRGCEWKQSDALQVKVQGWPWAGWWLLPGAGWLWVVHVTAAGDAFPHTPSQAATAGCSPEGRQLVLWPPHHPAGSHQPLLQVI